MKKTIIILMILAIILSSLSFNVFANYYYYYTRDIDSFVKDCKAVFQGEKVKYLKINEAVTQILIPIPKSEDWKVSEISESYYDTCFYYTVSNYRDPRQGCFDVGVLRTREDYERVAKKYAQMNGYELIDDSIVHVKGTKNRDIWLFPYGEYAVEVEVPVDIVISSAEELNKFFEFHIYDLASDKVYDTNQFYVPDGASVEIPDLSTMSNEVEPPDTTPDPAPPVDETPDAPVDGKTPSWKVPVIVTSCAAVVAVAALGTLVVVKKRKSK